MCKPKNIYTDCLESRNGVSDDKFENLTLTNFIYCVSMFDVIFTQIFKPDRMNGFEIQTDAEAMMERQRRDLIPGLTTPKTPGRGR